MDKPAKEIFEEAMKSLDEMENWGMLVNLLYDKTAESLNKAPEVLQELLDKVPYHMLSEYKSDAGMEKHLVRVLADCLRKSGILRDTMDLMTLVGFMVPTLRTYRNAIRTIQRVEEGREE